MANYHHGATYGSLAYDLDALAREKQLDEAGKLPQKKVRPAQPEVQPVQRRQSAARAAVRPSPVLLLGTVLVVGMVIALMLCYVKLTGISDNVSSIKREISALEEEHVALLTAYERTFDLATVKAAAEAAGMSKPSSGQIQYIDLSGADSVELPLLVDSVYCASLGFTTETILALFIPNTYEVYWNISAEGKYSISARSKKATSCSLLGL